MNPAWWQVALAAATVLCSVGLSAFISGMRWGETKTRLENIEKDVRWIMGAFTIVPKSSSERGD